MNIRLQKILSQAGVASRRNAEKLILEGRISIDGVIVRELGTKVDPNKNKILFNGQPLQLEKKIYIVLNKPKEYICTSKDTHDRKIVLDLVKGIKERLFTVGRLDKDTEGLMLLTNDGEFANKLLHPSCEINKIYYATIDKNISQKDIVILEKGIRLEDSITAPCKIEKKNDTELYITIHEGKKRQIRLMFDSLGYKVINLKRIQFGSLELKELKVGTFRHLTHIEKLKLLKTI